MDARPSRWGTVTAAALLLATVSCGGEAGPGTPAAGTAVATDASAAGYEIDCSLFDQFGDLDGTRVMATALGVPTTSDIPPWRPFEECTGVDVHSEGFEEADADLVVRLGRGDPPDVTFVTQPGQLISLVETTGAVLPVFEETLPVVQEGFSADWLRYATVDGTLYGFPHGLGNVKSLVWYSPAAFAAGGYQVPETWEELIALSDRIVADHPDGGVKPWCAGIASGDVTGWPLTDWVEDVMLREQGAEYYDAWVDHDVPFNAQASLEVWETVGSVLRNPDYVNGGIGDVASIASTSFADAGLPILDGTCYMTKMPSFFVLAWPEGTGLSPDGDIFAFYLPTKDGSSDKPVLAATEYVVAVQDRPEVRAFMTYLASEDYVNGAAGATDAFVSAHRGLSLDNVSSPIGKLAVELLRDPRAVIRHDGSDVMPGEVGAGTFWSEGTAWISEGKDTQAVLDAIESSWPE